MENSKERNIPAICRKVLWTCTLSSGINQECQLVHNRLTINIRFGDRNANTIPFFAKVFWECCTVDKANSSTLKMWSKLMAFSISIHSNRSKNFGTCPLLNSCSPAADMASGIQRNMSGFLAVKPIRQPQPAQRVRKCLVQTCKFQVLYIIDHFKVLVYLKMWDRTTSSFFVLLILTF